MRSHYPKTSRHENKICEAIRINMEAKWKPREHEKTSRENRNYRKKKSQARQRKSIGTLKEICEER